MAATHLYTPTSDAIERHDYGVGKNRKAASTGGGRAWSEDEEVYLLQTRLQKMPYKHIAAHLKKTELACRLHYHQLSHGSNRRKRTTSVSSGSSTGGHSPTLHPSIPSPILESSPSPSPPGSSGGYRSSMTPTSAAIHLPSISTGMPDTSPRLPTILPKPASMTLALNTMPHQIACGYPTPMVDTMPPHSAPLLASANYIATPTSATAPPHSATTPSLRLDCSAIPPPPPSMSQIDMTRLHAIYATHRTSFWTAVATEYGPGVNPIALEQAWRSAAAFQTATPITPSGSPDERDMFYHGRFVHGGPDKTRISAILGIDANPRSPKEREMVRRLEEERVVVGVAA